ncbi:MAG: hypothetical protein GY830_10315 [Bacteroidetes bacterium]|nr:hypothetical protein [Bacteroidota bacterium]
MEKKLRRKKEKKKKKNFFFFFFCKSDFFWWKIRFLPKSAQINVSVNNVNVNNVNVNNVNVNHFILLLNPAKLVLALYLLDRFCRDFCKTRGQTAQAGISKRSEIEAIAPK